MEQSLVAYLQLLTVPGGDPEAGAAAEQCADHARGEFARGLQARPLCLRMLDRPLGEVDLALCQVGLCDHAAVLVTGASEAARRPIG
jgi:hypothetical protein